MTITTVQPKADQTDYIAVITQRLNARFNDTKRLNPLGYLDSFANHAWNCTYWRSAKT